LIAIIGAGGVGDALILLERTSTRLEFSRKDRRRGRAINHKWDKQYSNQAYYPCDTRLRQTQPVVSWRKGGRYVLLSGLHKAEVPLCYNYGMNSGHNAALRST
jgi:hypothetical protein